jgi:Carboxypeptidase regulatory-like domain
MQADSRQKPGGTLLTSGSCLGFKLLLCATVFCLLARPTWGQIRINSGDIRGVVVDQSGAGVPGAMVGLFDPERGKTLNALTNERGEFRFPLLAPYIYEIEVESAGFKKRLIENISVDLGETVQLKVQLQIKPVESQIDVIAEIPAVDFSRTQQAASVESYRLEKLPINRRNYLDFAQLTPGIVDTEHIADAADLRISVSPTSGLSFAGGNGRGNSFSVDGISINGATGNVRPSVSQTAVDEFQVNRNAYSAEYGGGYGGAINIVSKSGTNALHGTAFGYLRDRDLQARNFFDPYKSAFTRVQSGVSVGGPIRKNRTFFFTALERLDRHESSFVPILTDPDVLTSLTPSQADIASFGESSGSLVLQSTAGLMSQLLPPSINPRVKPLLQSNSGVFPFSGKNTQFSFRLDHTFSQRNEIFMRANLTRERLQNSRLGALVGFSHGGETGWYDNSIMGSWTHLISPKWMSVVRASVADTRFDIHPNESYGPELIINGFGIFGRDYLYPFHQDERYAQGQLSLNYAGGKHSVKFGIDISPIRNAQNLQTFFGGRFVFGEFLPLSILLNTVTADPNFSASAASEMSRLGRSDLAAKLNDPISSLQTFSLGLPVAYIQGFGNPVTRRWRQHYSSFVEDTYKAAEGLTLNAGARLQVDRNENFPNRSYVAPRIGFAWKPIRSNDTFAVRGGYGLFFSYVDLNVVVGATEIQRSDETLLFVTLLGLPGVINPATGKPVTSADIYNTLSANKILGNRTIQLEDLRSLGILPGFQSPSKGGVQSDYTSPYSEQAGLEIEKAFQNELSIRVSYTFSRAAHLWRSRDQNLIQVGTRPDHWPIFGLRDTTILNNFVLESSGNAFYHAMTLEANKRLRRHWALNAHYTWSKAIDDVTDFNLDYMPHNQFDLHGERGLSLFHQAHRFVVSGYIESPGVRDGTKFWNRLLADWTVAPIVQASSFRPFNTLTGVDNLGDGQINTHRPLGAGRNIGIGPNFFTVNVRLVRRILFGVEERRNIEFSAEAFNVLNRTNFQSVNNIVGNISLSKLPKRIVGHVGNPTQPLAFTSAYDPRQFQLGAKINF